MESSWSYSAVGLINMIMEISTVKAKFVHNSAYFQFMKKLLSTYGESKSFTIHTSIFNIKNEHFF